MKKNESRKVKSIFFFNSFLLVLVLVAASLCVKSIDDLMFKNFELQEIRERKTLLNRENLNLEILTSELQSHGNVASRIDELKMVKVSQVEYLVVSDDTLARR